MPTQDETDIAYLRARLEELETERSSLRGPLANLQSKALPIQTSHAISAPITAQSKAAEKIGLFRRLFAGRADVFPLRWENRNTGKSGYAPACANEWVRGICNKPHVKCTECPNQAFIAVSDSVIARHLRGEDNQPGGAGFVVGVYPILLDGNCWFVTADFDGENWSADASAFMETCRLSAVPAALERSRSGEGGHVWIFFTHPIPARDARKLGAILLTATLERRPELGFASYDRLFPSQDTLPEGGFGNLIALPLQRRARDYGNSVFIDPNQHAYPDQWAFLASVARLTPKEVYTRIEAAEARDRVLAVRMPIADEDGDEPWNQPPSQRLPIQSVTEPLPDRVKIVLSDDIYIDRAALPASMIARLVRLAAFQNPEFYQAQAMRRSTFDKPRIVSCAKLHPRHVALPRGCLEESFALLRSHRVEIDVEDLRERGAELDCRFLGTLRPEQKSAVDALSKHDCGVLAATTAFGKTVVAAALIAHRRRSSLVLVHRKELFKQWAERLKQFLSLDSDSIGAIGGGRRKPTGRIDVALIQSLFAKAEVSDLIAGYGQIIVDECHHPVRHRVDPRSQALRRGFLHKDRIRDTAFALPPELLEAAGPMSMPAIYSALGRDELRNAAIFDDVLTALEAERCPSILTERRDHVEALRVRFERFTRNLVVLHGGLKAAERRVAQAGLETGRNEERLVLATGRYLGEGFDDARLDTLFLLMPVSWKGTLAQYVGRLHRA